MKIDELINLLQDMKYSGVEEVSLDRASAVENVCTNFRSGSIWLDGFDKNGEYVTAIEIEI